MRKNSASRRQPLQDKVRSWANVEDAPAKDEGEGENEAVEKTTGEKTF